MKHAVARPEVSFIMGHTYRLAAPSDDPILADIMFDAVRNGPSKYTEAQRMAWVPARREGHPWRERLKDQDIVVAEQDDEPVGFMSLASTGYIDFAYIRPVAQGCGLFRELFERIEGRAYAKGVNLLWVHASLAAQPAFSAVGFSIIRREVVRIGSENLERFEMEKRPKCQSRSD
jgi:putative acetyltransferase